MTTMLLKNLINNLDPKIANERVKGISSDSRKVKKGDLGGKTGKRFYDYS